MSADIILSLCLVIGGFIIMAIGITLSILMFRKQVKINSGEATAKKGSRFSRVVPFRGNFDAMNTAQIGRAHV